MRRYALSAVALSLLGLLGFGLLNQPSARADNTLHLVGNAALDPSTLIALGVRLPITGDDDDNATVAVRYRATTSSTVPLGTCQTTTAGTGTWKDALPL